MAVSSEPDLVFYDGGCALCHGFVRFLVSRDPDGSRFRFAPLHGPTFAGAIPAASRASLPDSVIVSTPEGSLLVKSAAAARALSRLSGPWPFAGRLLDATPRAWADAIYDLVARLRRRWRAAPATACPVPEPGRRGRFLD